MPLQSFRTDVADHVAGEIHVRSEDDRMSWGEACRHALFCCYFKKNLLQHVIVANDCGWVATISASLFVDALMLPPSRIKLLILDIYTNHHLYSNNISSQRVDRCNPKGMMFLNILRPFSNVLSTHRCLAKTVTLVRSIFFGFGFKVWRQSRRKYGSFFNP